MVAPLARDAVRIEMADGGYRREYVAMTLRMMEQFGQPDTTPSGDGMHISPPVRSAYRSGDHAYDVEPDASAASYFLALPLVTGGSVNLAGIRRPSLQGDAAFADRLAEVGATIAQSDTGTTSSFDRNAGRRVALRGDFHAISDTFLTLAAIAPLLEGETHISGIAHTRKQESDRVSAMATELRRIGQEVVEEHDAITIKPRPIKSGDIETYKDHRFAMSFAVLGCHDLNGDGTPWLRIKDPGCCAKTFPLFFEELEAARKQSLA
jgi:3-phosphoshikimate 1-carboxyvinyltransferase